MVQQDLTLGAPNMCRNLPNTIYRYLDMPSTQRIQTHNTHIHNTTPPSQTLAQAAHSLSPNTNATKTQTHIPLSPCSSRIGKAQTQFCHPLTPNNSHPAPSQTHTHVIHSTYTLSPHLSLARHLNHVYHPYTHSPQPHLP